MITSSLKLFKILYYIKQIVAVGLFSNRSQMTSKCGKNKEVAHEAQPSVTDDLLRRVLTIINRPLEAHHASLCIIEECLH